MLYISEERKRVSVGDKIQSVYWGDLFNSSSSYLSVVFYYLSIK